MRWGRWLLLFVLASLVAGCLLLPESETEPRNEEGDVATPVGAPDAPDAHSFGPWQIVSLAPPDAPAVLVPEGNTFRLDPAWELAEATLVYKWWGLAEPVLHISRVERQGEGYVRDGEAVPAERVAALREAMSGFYAGQFELAGQRHTDDYPSRTIELVGADGTRMILTSESTDNPGVGPWNLTVNGRTYSQLDGSLAEPLDALFDPDEETYGIFSSYPYDEITDIAFATDGRARTDIEGLLELRDSLFYGLSEDRQSIEGYIEGSSSIGQMGNMVIGTFDELAEVALTGPDGAERPCEISEEERDDPAGNAWSFRCPLGAAAPVSGYYRLPFRVALGTFGGERVTSEGTIVGPWEAFAMDEGGAATFDAPLPLWLTTAIERHEGARTLLERHRPMMALYSGAIPIGEPPEGGTYRGELVWVGWREHEGAQVAYTLGSPFAYEGGALTNWSLDASEAATLLDEVLAQPLTQRLRSEIPSLVVNLWYAERPEQAEPDSPYLMNDWYLGGYEAQLGACAGLPGPASLPSNAEPLRAYGFGGEGFGWRNPFVLLDGQTIVHDLDIWAEEERGAVERALLPAAFGEGAPTFDRIWAESAEYFVERPVLTLWIPEGTSRAELDSYRDFTATLPGTLDTEWGPEIWKLVGATFAVDEGGQIVLHDCAPDE